MRLFLRLLALGRFSWGWMALGAMLSLVALLANVALMGTSGWFITAMGLAGVAGGTLDYFSPAAMIRAFAILRTGGRYAERLVTHEATFRLIAALRVWLFERMEPQSPLALSAHHSGDLASRLRTDLDRLESACLRIALPFFVAVAAIPAIVAWLCRYAVSFAIIESLGLVLAGLFVPMSLSLSTMAWSRRRVGLLVHLNEAAVDIVQGMAELLAFGAAQRFVGRFSEASRAAIAAQTRLGLVDGLAQAGLLLGGNLALWGVVVAAIPLVRQGGLAPADMVMAGLVALAAFEAVAPLPGAFQSLGGVLESAGRIFALADACPASAEPLVGRPALPARCDLRLRGLDFAYRAGDRPILAGIDLDLPQGRKVAVLGPTGAGKSTLVLLLTGLVRPTGGRILLGDRPSGDFDGESWRSLFAVAPQSPGLFCGTLADNLRLGRADASDADLMHALEVAGLADFVAMAPGGLGCWLGETGLTLSGGQARRLSVARALLKTAPVLILDEPGEGLDYRSEQAMLSAVVGDLGGRSLMLITHRAAGLDLVDDVIRLEPVTAF